MNLYKQFGKNEKIPQQKYLNSLFVFTILLTSDPDGSIIFNK